MSIQLILTAMGDFSDVEIKQAIAIAKNKEIKQAIEENEAKTLAAYNHAIAGMRASYMMVSGVAQTMGGSMADMFSAMYGIVTSGIQTTAAIASALYASGPYGWVQAAMMTASLITAVVNLGALQSGQTELARQVSGVNMAIQGMGSMIGMCGFE